VAACFRACHPDEAEGDREMTRRETLIVASLLIALAAGLHWLHYLLFGNLHDLLFYLVLDLAFLPVNILVVVLIVDRVMAEREKSLRRHQMNMVIGTFFGEMGAPLLRAVPRLMPNDQALLETFSIQMGWDEGRLRQAARLAETMRGDVQLTPELLTELRDTLSAGRDFMLRLLGNPNLLEHEGFTDLLWAMFHLADELVARPSLDSLPAADVRHLAADAQRAYQRLLAQWFVYLLHLKRDYPYLYSFAVRTNPLDPDAKVGFD
jgi:hypothetical protein